MRDLNPFYIFILFFLPSTLWGQSGIYIAPAMNLAYGSGSGDSKSSLLGPSFALAAGMRANNIGAEMEFKQIKLTNSQIGNKDYDTEIYDTIFSGGVRFFLQNVFSIKLGLSQHFVEMNINKDGQSLDNEEEDGQFFGFYGGMGIIHQFTKDSEVFLESTLYPVPDIDMYIVDMQLGLRILL